MDINLVAPAEAIGPFPAVSCPLPATLLVQATAVFLYLFILRDFKSNNLVTAEGGPQMTHQECSGCPILCPRRTKGGAFQFLISIPPLAL